MLENATAFMSPPLLSALVRICIIKNSIFLKARYERKVLLDFSLTVKAATLIFIPGCGSAILSGKEGKSGFIYNLVNS